MNSETSVKFEIATRGKSSNPTRTSYTQLIVEQRGAHILLLQFNRPAQCNALNRRAYYELIRALNVASKDVRIKIIVITGVGDMFTAGNDLKQLRQYSDASEFFKSSNYVLRSLAKTFLSCPKVIVALVNGPCIGVGFTLAALCDVVYCTENAYFHANFTKLGLCPEACATYLFPRILGRSKATEVLLFAEKLTAAEAYEFKFVARIFKNSLEVDNLLWPKLLEYSKLPMESLIVTKKLLRSPTHADMVQALMTEIKELSQLRYGDVYMNAVESFIQKSEINKSKL